MTLQSAGPISAADINVELGRPATAPFNINGSEERALAGRPSGAISFADFYGKSRLAASIDSRTVNRSGTAPPAVVSAYRLHADGNVYDHNLAAALESWRDAGNSSDFEARATVISAGSGAFGGDAFGSWLSLSSDRAWTFSSTVSTNGSLTVEIRAVGGAVLTSATITFANTVSGGGGGGPGGGGP